MGRSQSALDFGCGNGDFSRLLLRLGFKVVGYDPYVRPAISDTDFTYVSDYVALARLTTADLALSITTLDHILGIAEAREAVCKIRSSLRRGGQFCMLEYALDSEADRPTFNLRNNYQSFRLLRDWEDILGSSGFGIIKVRPAPHPLLCPSPGYLQYANSFLARVRWRFPRMPLCRIWNDPLLRWQAEKSLGHGSVSGRNARSPLKLILSEAI